MTGEEALNAKPESLWLPGFDFGISLFRIIQTSHYIIGNKRLAD